MSGPRRSRKASTAAPPPVHHQHSRPFSGGSRTSLDGPAPGQAGLQDPNSSQRGPERTASCGLLINSAGNPPPGGRGTGRQASMLASVSESMTGGLRWPGMPKNILASPLAAGTQAAYKRSWSKFGQFCSTHGLPDTVLISASVVYLTSS